MVFSDFQLHPRSYSSGVYVFFPLHNLPAAPNGFKMQKAFFSHRSAVKMPDVEQAQPASPIMHYHTLFTAVSLAS